MADVRADALALAYKQSQASHNQNRAVSSDYSDGGPDRKGVTAVQVIGDDVGRGGTVSSEQMPEEEGMGGKEKGYPGKKRPETNNVGRT